MKKVNLSLSLLFAWVLLLSTDTVVEARVGRELLSSKDNAVKQEGARGSPIYRALGSCDHDQRRKKEEYVGAAEEDDDGEEMGDDSARDDDDYSSNLKGYRSKRYSATNTKPIYVQKRRLKMSKGSKGSKGSSRSRSVDDDIPPPMLRPSQQQMMMRMMRMRMRMRMNGTVAPTVSSMPSVAPSTLAPSVSTMPSTVPSKGPTGAPSVSTAPSATPSSTPPSTTPAPNARTRPPRQPMRMRMRMRRPMRNNNSNRSSRSGMSSKGSKGRSEPTRGQGNNRTVRYIVQASLEYLFAPGTGMNPTRQEINALVRETEDFYLDTFDSRRLTRNAPITDFQMRNLQPQYATNGDLDSFILHFNGIASAPASVFLESEDIARIMGNADYDSYILNYVYEAAPFTQSIFYQTTNVFFSGQAVNFAS